jgi:hypothetical protein
MISILIFCLVLFIYLHIQFHLKTSDDLEMYEASDPSKDRLEEICDLRQPVLFNFECDAIMNSITREYIKSNYSAFELKIRNSKEGKDNEQTELYMPLQSSTSFRLFDEDKNACYFTENNADFLDETGICKIMKYNDVFLRPYMVSNCNYDIWMGSADVCTPFRYDVNYRNYYLITQGTAQVKLSPPSSKKYLHPKYDYENFEFTSPINVWNPQPKFALDYEKIKCLEFTLTAGQTLYIPAYWWYSVKFNKATTIACFNYRTYINNLAITPYVALHALQMQNIKRVSLKKVGTIDIHTHQPSDEHINETKTPNTTEQINKNAQELEPEPKQEPTLIPEPSSLMNDDTFGSLI